LPCSNTVLAKRITQVFLLATFLVRGASAEQSDTAEPTRAYLGFDRNQYPGDANLKALRQTFSYTGYWLNNPPGA